MAELANSFATSSAPAFSLRGRYRPSDIPRNPLFATLSRQQLRFILPYLKFKRLGPDKKILLEGDRNPGKIFIILQGTVAIRKAGVSPVALERTVYEIGALRRGDIFGEVSFVENKPSAMSFYAKTDVELVVVDLSAARRSQRTKRLRDMVAAKMRRYLASRVDESADLRLHTLRLQHEFAAYRSGLGHIIITTLCLLSLYTLALSFLPAFNGVIHANFALTPLIIILFALSFVPIVATSGFPLPFFGLTLRNWRESVLLAFAASGAFLVAFLLAKWILINSFTLFQGLSLLDGADVRVSGEAVSLSSWYWIALIVYLILTPMQEFVARSGIQAPLYAFLHGSEAKRRWFSIVVSNLVFAAAHAHISLAFAIAAFLPGLLWGWIFARTNSLLAATVSHIIVGGMAIFVFGIEDIVTRLSA